MPAKEMEELKYCVLCGSFDYETYDIEEGKVLECNRCGCFKISGTNIIKLIRKWKNGVHEKER
jgi:hypothetical protein